MASGGSARVAQLEYLWGPGERIPVGVGRRDLQITPEATEAYPGFLCVLKEVVAAGKCLSCGIDQIGKRGDFAASAAPWIWLSQTPLLQSACVSLLQYRPLARRCRYHSSALGRVRYGSRKEQILGSGDLNRSGVGGRVCCHNIISLVTVIYLSPTPRVRGVYGCSLHSGRDLAMPLPVFGTRSVWLTGIYHRPQVR